MKVEMIFVGTELLLGNIVNTNGQFLAEQCASIGLPVYYQTVVGDNEQRLTGTIQAAFERCDTVILCGGLGPTEDDITREVCAKTMDMPLKEDPEIRKELEEKIRKTGSVITENVFKQAMIPEGAKILPNNNGTAHGLVMEKDGKTAILLPGPSAELEPMFMNYVRPYFVERSGQVITSAVVKICGVSESVVETRLLDLVDTQTNPTIATYVKTGEVHVRVTAAAPTESEARKLLKPCVKELKRRFKGNVFTTKEDVTLEMELFRLLKKYGLTMTTAESCTGGMVAARLVSLPGISDVFSEGLVTYSNRAKRKFLDVNKVTLKKYSAVSAETAREMAIGGVFANDSDICVSVTGVAGPDGGTENAPVGRVYIGCYLNGVTKVREYTFSGNREKIREYAASAALDLARRCIIDQYKKSKRLKYKDYTVGVHPSQKDTESTHKKQRQQSGKKDTQNRDIQNRDTQNTKSVKSQDR